MRRIFCVLLLSLWIILCPWVSVYATGIYYMDKEASSANVVVGEPVQEETPAGETETAQKTYIRYRVLQKKSWTEYCEKGSTAENTEKEESITNLDVVVSSPYEGTVKFKTYTKKGWGAYTTTENSSVTKGKIQAIAIKLTGQLSELYDIYYKVHVTDGYWLDWASNGHAAGSMNLNQRINAIKLRLVKKGKKISGDTEYPCVVAPDITYKMALGKQKLSPNYKELGKTSGSKKNKTGITGIKMKISDRLLPGGLEYRVAQEKGKYGSWISSGKLAGSEKSEKYLSRIQIRLTGQLAKAYDIYYRVQVKRYGWLDWAKNGQSAGSDGLGLCITAYQVKLRKKKTDKPLKTDTSYLKSDQQEYVIKVNKRMNCITVYLHNKPIKAFICSTGEATPTGTFYTMVRYRWKELIHEVWGQYCTRIVGHILFHSVPYHECNNKTLLTGSFRKLGKTASAGCIRLTCIDAKWIYDNCKLKTKVIIYNSKDPGPLGKPKAPYLPRGQTWDPTDPAFS